MQRGVIFHQSRLGVKTKVWVAVDSTSRAAAVHEIGHKETLLCLPNGREIPVEESFNKVLSDLGLIVVANADVGA